MFRLRFYVIITHGPIGNNRTTKRKDEHLKDETENSIFFAKVTASHIDTPPPPPPRPQNQLKLQSNFSEID